MNATVTGTCPEWCAADHTDDPRWMATVHYRRWGDLGVEAWAESGGDGSLGAAHLTIGDFVDIEDLSLDQARKLGSDLIAAVQAIEEAAQ